MTTVESYVINVVLKSARGEREITSPPFDTREEADSALNVIREAQHNSDWINLDWLSVSSGYVVAAYVEDKSIFFGVV